MYNNWQTMGPYAAAAGQAQATNMFTGMQTGQAGAPPVMGMDGNMQQQQQMYQWYYGNWQQQPQPGMMQQGYQQYPPPLPTGQTVNPAPPVEPPSDVKPPLPPEPPPPPKEADKLDQKKPHPNPPKQPWQQPPPPAEEPPIKPPPPQPQAPKAEVDPVLKSQMDDLLKEETAFSHQYDQWKQQYRDWQEQNKNHPNKEQFDQYLDQWKQYEQQMETRRVDIESRKKTLEDAIKGPGTSRVTQGPGGSTGGPPAPSQGLTSPGQGPPGAPGPKQFQSHQTHSTNQDQRGLGSGTLRPQGPGGSGPGQQFSSGGFSNERQGQFGSVSADSSSSGREVGGLRPPEISEGAPGFQQRGPLGTMSTKSGSQDLAEGGEDDMDLDDTGQDESSQNLQDFSHPSQVSGQQGFQAQGPGFREPGQQNYQGGHGQFQGGRGDPQSFRGRGPSNYRGGQNFQSGPGYHSYENQGWHDVESGNQDSENWQNNSWQGEQFHDQRGGYRGRGMPRGGRGRGGPDNVRGRGRGMPQSGFGDHDMQMDRDSEDQRHGGPDSMNNRGRGTGRGGFGGRGNRGMDHGMSGEMGRGGFGGRGGMGMDQSGPGDGPPGRFRGKGMGPDGFRGRGGVPMRGRGGGQQGFGGPGGNFNEDSYEETEDNQNYDQYGQNEGFGEPQQNMGRSQQFQGQGMRGRGGPGMQGRGGPGHFQGRGGGPPQRGRGGPWHGPNTDFQNRDQGQGDYSQDDWADDHQYQDYGSGDFSGGNYGNQFPPRGRGGPPRGRGGPGFSASRGRGMSEGPTGFSGPHGQRGRGRSLLGDGPPGGPGHGGPMPLMSMNFNEKVMEDRLGKEGFPGESENPDVDSEFAQQTNNEDSASKALSGKALGLGDKLPLSFGKGGGFSNEDEEVVEGEEHQDWQYGQSQGRGFGRGRGRGRGRGGFYQAEDENEGWSGSESWPMDDGMHGRGRGRARGRGFAESASGQGRGVNEWGRGRGGAGESGPGRGGTFSERGRGRGGEYGATGLGRGRGFADRGRGRGGDGALGRGGAFGERGGPFEGGRGRAGEFGEGGRGRGGSFSTRGRGGAFAERGQGQGGPYGGSEHGGTEPFETGLGRGGSFEDSEQGRVDAFHDSGRGRGGRFGPGGPRGRGRGQFPGNRDADITRNEQPNRWETSETQDSNTTDAQNPPQDTTDPFGLPRSHPLDGRPPSATEQPRGPRDPAYLDDPYRRPVPLDPYDPYPPRVRDPFGRGFDPYRDRDPAAEERRVREDPYGDLYGRDPWVRDRPAASEPEPKRLFVPAESIDYGHMSTPKPATEDAAPKIKLEVIDYGHGSKTDDPIADLDREADRFERERASRLNRQELEYSHLSRESSSQADRDPPREDDRHDTDRRDRRNDQGDLGSRRVTDYRDEREQGFSDYRSRRDDRSRYDSRSRDDFDREELGRPGDRYGARSDRSQYLDRLDRRDDIGRLDSVRDRSAMDDRDSRFAREDRFGRDDHFNRDKEFSRDERQDRFSRGMDRQGYGDRMDRFDRPEELGYIERDRSERGRPERDRFDRDRSDTDRFERGDRDPYDRDRLARADRRDGMYDRERDPYGRERDSVRRERDSLGKDRDPFDRDSRNLHDSERDLYGRERDRHSRERDSSGREREQFGRDRDSFNKPDPRDRDPVGRDRDSFGRDRDLLGKEREPFGRSDTSGRLEPGRADFPDRAGFMDREEKRPDMRSDSGKIPTDLRPREIDRVRESDPGGLHDRSRSPRDFSRSPRDFHTPPTVPPVHEKAKVEDLICNPGRISRPPHLVVIVRGLPGSGKTYVSKLLREKEIASGGSAPRMLSLDDYFMVEVEKKEIDPDTGKKVTRKALEYEYEQDMEEAYLQSLFKSFKKTIDDGFFPFIIVDAINEKVKSFEPFWSYAKSKGFQDGVLAHGEPFVLYHISRSLQKRVTPDGCPKAYTKSLCADKVYVAELEADVPTCINRNIHKWTEYDVEKVKGRWEPTPPHFMRLDIRWLLQEDSITEVEMEDAPEEGKTEEGGTGAEKRKREDADDEDEESGVYKKSKWELDTSEVKLDKLDGLSHGMHKREKESSTTMEDYLQLSDDYFKRKSTPGKKMVRWADLEERKEQSRRRELGFVVGQTQKDWDRITDDKFAEKALNQTKYI